MPNLTSNDMRRLWPGPARRLNENPVSQIQPRKPIASGGFERAVPITIKKFPVHTVGYFRYYLVLSGAAKIQVPPGNASNQFAAAYDSNTREGERAVVLKYETAITNNITFEGNMTPSLAGCRAIAAGDWNGAAKELLSGRLKTSHDLWYGIKGATEYDLTADEHWCFFGVTAKVAVPISFHTIAETLTGGGYNRKDNVALPDNLMIECEGALTLRMGLSRKGWAYVARRVSGSTVQAAANSISQQSARAAVTQALGSMGIPMIGAAAGVGLLYLNGCLLCYYASKGKRLGILTTYCNGYLVKIFEARTNDTGHYTRHYKNTAGTDNAAAHYVAGYRDAETAIRRGGANGLALIEKILLDNFGLNYHLTMRGWRASKKYGDTIDKEYEEARKIAGEMAAYMTDNIDAVSRHVGVSNAGWNWY